jgi:trimeric autotransporter adhesin
MRFLTALCVLASILMVGCGSGTVGSISNNGSGNPPATNSPSLTSITISPSITSLGVGISQQLKATGKYSDGSSKDLTSSATWSSSNADMAKVSSGGLVTGVNSGNVTITAAEKTISNSLKLSIVPASPGPVPLTSITITPAITSLGIGAIQQLTATGKYSDGSSKNLTSTVTWSSSSSSLATINGGGLVTGIKSGNITITAAYQSTSSSLKFSIVPVLQAMTVSPMGPAIVVGNKQRFTVSGSFNDGSVQDLTATATWSASDATIATFAAAGQATGLKAGAVTVTATSNGISGAAVLNVVSKAYPAFIGPYAFTMIAADSRGPAFFNGSIAADSNGNITGVEDSNTTSGVSEDIAITGTYTTYPDGRGTMTFNPNQCHPNGITLRFLMSAGGTLGSMIEFDGKGTLKGSMSQQSSAAFNAGSLNGTYVFRAIGIDSGVAAPNTSGTPQPMGQVGVLATDGNGNITGGNEDVNDYGTFTPFVQLNSSTYSVDSSTGRGTLQLVSGSGTSNFAFYVVDSTRINLIEIDSAPASAVAGVAELQAAQTYSVASLNASFAFLLDRPAVAVSGNNFTFADYEQIGFYSFNGSTSVVGTRDWESIVGTVGVTGTGHGTLTTNLPNATATNQDYRAYSFYMVSPTKMFLLQTGTQPVVASYSPEVGEADLQTGGPYTNASLNGSYALGSYNLASDAAVLMLISYNGTGGITGIADVAASGTINTALIGPAQFSIEPKNSGFLQATMTFNNSSVTYDFFLTSPQQAWVGGANPPLDGTLQVQ